MRVLPCLLVIVAVLPAGPAIAQSPGEPRGFVAVNAGMMRENAEDGLRQTSSAVGLAVGVRVAPRWMLEVGVSDNGIGSPEHGERLVSVGALRLFRDAGARPYVTAGLTFGSSSDTRTACFADHVPPGGGAPQRALVDCTSPGVLERVEETFTSRTGYFLIGGGVQIPLGRRVMIVPDVRIDFAATSVILRPSVGLAFNF